MQHQYQNESGLFVYRQHTNAAHLKLDLLVLDDSTPVRNIYKLRLVSFNI